MLLHLAFHSSLLVCPGPVDQDSCGSSILFLSFLLEAGASFQVLCLPVRSSADQHLLPGLPRAFPSSRQPRTLPAWLTFVFSGSELWCAVNVCAWVCVCMGHTLNSGCVNAYCSEGSFEYVLRCRFKAEQNQNSLPTNFFSFWFPVEEK